MKNLNGVPVRGVLHTTDASAVVAVPLYINGDATGSTRALAGNEQLEITGITLVSVAGGDCLLYCGSSSTRSTAPFVVARGTVAANGGLVSNFVADGLVTPDILGTLWFKAPAGVCDLLVTGRIHGDPSAPPSPAARPAWQAAPSGTGLT